MMRGLLVMIKLVTYNIRYGIGKDGVLDVDRIIREVAGADVIALQEVVRNWSRPDGDGGDDVDQVQAIADGLGDYYWVYGAGVDLHVEGSEPREGRRRQFGNMVLSRWPVLRCRHHLLPKVGSTGPLSVQRSAVEATVRCGGRTVRVYSVHLTHLCGATRVPQVKALLSIHERAVFEGAAISGDVEGYAWAEEAGGQEVPREAIMMGDFNFQPSAPEYELMAGPVSDYGGRITNPAGFVDAWCAAGNAIDEGVTSDVNGRPARLDYCFVSAALRGLIKGCRVDDAATGSDHFPVWVSVDL